MEGKPLTKCYWKDVRSDVAKVNPEFTKLVDQVSPDRKFPLYKALYPYGAIIADTETFFLPGEENNFFTLNDPGAPKELLNNLGYGKNSIPLGIVLDKNIEYFTDVEDEQLSLTTSIYKPGSVFPTTQLFKSKNQYPYATNSILSMVSGARSTFMLPNIGCSINHANLQRDFNVSSTTPKSLYEHWNIFKEISNSNILATSWYSSLIYFSETWQKKLIEDPAWINLKMHLLTQALQQSEYYRSQHFLDFSLSLIQKKRNLKPNPYLADTAKHLLGIVLGVTPGHAPAIDDSFLPTALLQKTFVESYGLKKYYPTIMQPCTFNFERLGLPVYYSLQNPAAFSFSPKARKLFSTLIEMRELAHINSVFFTELSKQNNICSNTIVEKACDTVKLDYFHNKLDKHNILQDSSEIPKYDTSFIEFKDKSLLQNKEFARDAKFVRGCIKISKHPT